MSTPIIIEGKQVGKFRASFLLFKETFRFLLADKEMMWVPIITGIIQMFFIGTFVVLFDLGTVFSETEVITGAQYGYVLVLYIICAFTIAYAQATIAHIVYTRIHGGDATLGEGIKVAGAHASALFVWACITSTIGLLLRMVAERSQLLARIFIALLGAMWSVLTYFVVPAIIIDKKSPFAAIRHSGSVFKRTWGETLVTNISFGFVFLVAIFALVFVLIGFIFLAGGSPLSMFIGIGVFLVSIFGLVLLSSVLDSVLRTLLYVYASEQVIPQNFSKELLEGMLVRKNKVEAEVH